MSEAALYQFALAADVLQAGAGGVTMSVLDSSGNVLFSQSATAGQPTVTRLQYLKSGTYSVRYTYSAVSGKTNVAVQFNLFMLKLTDPVGPYATNTSSSSGGSTGSSGGGTSSGGSDSGYTYDSSSSSNTSSGYWYSF